MPADFTATSVSNAGKGVLYVLGSARCGSARCATLARSSDNGRTWHAVHTFAAVRSGAGMQPAAGAGSRAGGSSPAQVRFAGPDVGWVFGSGIGRGSGAGGSAAAGVEVTRDGGRTWSAYAHPGDAVLALETDGSTVFLATSTDCGSSACTGPVAVSAVPVGAAGARTVAGRTTSAGGVGTAALALDAGRAYLAAAPALTQAATPATGVARLGGSGLVSLSSPTSCGGGAPGAGFDVVTTAGTPGTVFGICPVDAGAGSVGYAVSVSTDGGASWTDRHATLALQTGPLRSFAAADATHLVAVSGGDAGRGGSLQVSRDGGTTWSAGSVASAPSGGWSWVGAAGGGTYEAVAASAEPGFWRSTDHGRHWRLVSVR